MSNRILIGMSGGVDSSVSALLLKNEGYEVVGITFRFIDDFSEEDAVKVCETLGIEHHVVDYRSEFKKEIIDKFLEDYSHGLTPNPCIHCNKVCKFKFLIDNMKKYNCDFIATGHYAKIDDGKLYKSVDKMKDQSYFLYNIPKDYISKIKFPLEGYSKDKVRDIARENGLLVADKKDSFDVCFITDSFKKYMNENTSEESGDIINIDTNEVIGKHNGLSKYTIGQRRGLDIGGTDDRLFVCGKDMTKNILYVCLGDDNPYLYSNNCIVTDVNLLVDDLPSKCMAKFRYRQNDIEVEVKKIDDNNIKVNYSSLRAVTPGQSCVLYDNDLCLGGGIIKDVYKDTKKIGIML